MLMPLLKQQFPEDFPSDDPALEAKVKEAVDRFHRLVEATKLPHEEFTKVWNREFPDNPSSAEKLPTSQ